MGVQGADEKAGSSGLICSFNKEELVSQLAIKEIQRTCTTHTHTHTTQHTTQHTTHNTQHNTTQHMKNYSTTQHITPCIECQVPGDSPAVSNVDPGGAWVATAAAASGKSITQKTGLLLGARDGQLEGAGRNNEYAHDINIPCITRLCRCAMGQQTGAASPARAWHHTEGETGFEGGWLVRSRK